MCAYSYVVNDRACQEAKLLREVQKYVDKGEKMPLEEYLRLLETL